MRHNKDLHNSFSPIYFLFFYLGLVSGQIKAIPYSSAFRQAPLLVIKLSSLQVSPLKKYNTGTLCDGFALEGRKTENFIGHDNTFES